MEVLGDISNFCRFCLTQDYESLMPLSSAIESLSFSLQDIQETTGISILESETTCLAVCSKCSNRIELAVDFRRSCLNGNVLFLQLFGHIINKFGSSDIAEENLEDAEYVKDDPLEIEITLQNELTIENTLLTHDGASPVLSVEESQELFDKRTNGQEECETENSCSEDLSDVPTNMSTSIGKAMNSKVAAAASKCKKTKSKERAEECEDKTNKTMKRRKSGKRQKLLCGICGALVYNIIDHTRSHTKENLLKCPHCPVQMANATNLARHVHSVHEKTVIKSCEHCGKGFITLDSYKSHLRTYHNIGKQYQCEICLKIFKHPSSRRDHKKRMHFAEWKHECQICQKKFKDMDALKRHGRVHSTNTPYACSHCPKRFKSPFAKKSHEITHSGVQFPCTICNKMYRYKSLLSMHYRKYHPADDGE
ncbi:zinc finger protein 14-like isoform X2 [Anopheles aquasalis]|uniref:zinc finger protein 14-like isoform X2 n=1 Tax=Anopheles aquasalis TaxID=42839 RepID=UPI00215AC40C|nr:zinc finger protein 14-like isoform X2 [Anopheles aquasalis]